MPPNSLKRYSGFALCERTYAYKMFFGIIVHVGCNKVCGVGIYR